MAPVGVHSFVHHKNRHPSNVSSDPNEVKSKSDRLQRAQSARVSKDDMTAARQKLPVAQHLMYRNGILTGHQHTLTNGSDDEAQVGVQARPFSDGALRIADTESPINVSSSVSDASQNDQENSNPDTHFHSPPRADRQAVKALAIYNAVNNQLGRGGKNMANREAVVEETQFSSQYPSTTDGMSSEGVVRGDLHYGDAIGDEEEGEGDDDENYDSSSASYDANDREDNEEDDDMTQSAHLEPRSTFRDLANNTHPQPPTKHMYLRPLPQHYTQLKYNHAPYDLQEQPSHTAAHEPANREIYGSISSHQDQVSFTPHQQISRFTASSVNQEADRIDPTSAQLDARLPSPTSITKSKPSAASGPWSRQLDRASTDENAAAEGLQVYGARIPASRKSKEERPSNDSLDYERQSLSTMDFRTLMKEDFDYIPQAHSFSLASNMSAGTLHEQLAHVAAMRREDQQIYFASLPKADWEQAGDWFLDQYSRLMVEIRKKRSEKRRIARQFEEEVSKRHEAVSGEKHCLDGALKKMKSSGTSILAYSTPKRKAV